jgi:hypothetical protein
MNTFEQIQNLQLALKYSKLASGKNPSEEDITYQISLRKKIWQLKGYELDEDEEVQELINEDNENLNQIEEEDEDDYDLHEEEWLNYKSNKSSNFTMPKSSSSSLPSLDLAGLGSLGAISSVGSMMSGVLGLGALAGVGSLFSSLIPSFGSSSIASVASDATSALDNTNLAGFLPLLWWGGSKDKINKGFEKLKKDKEENQEVLVAETLNLDTKSKSVVKLCYVKDLICSLDCIKNTHEVIFQDCDGEICDL